jgi:NAD(P)-dependent dehydrogenase (short-subunit alcohol dehydrogenase family)
VSGRLAGKVAIVMGAGQTPGDTIGNGRATALLFAREGARVIAVDRSLDSAEETVAQIHGEDGEADAIAADATSCSPRWAPSGWCSTCSPTSASAPLARW